MLDAPLVPEQSLAEGFSAQVHRWARAQGGTDQAAKAARRAAYQVSMAVAAGHVCIPLAEIAESLGGDGDLGRLRDELLNSGVVGTPEARGAMPLILDGEGRLYLHRYFDYERRLAEDVLARVSLGRHEEIAPAVAVRLSELFAKNGPSLGGVPDWQQVAVAMALLSGFTVISGGPGTGKTTTVVNLLCCLLEQNPGCRIALAAPTGKAAARMTEAMRDRSAHLPEEMRQRLPAEAFTIHRLLGVLPDRNGFRHDADNRLPLDVLVVDEASMLDLALATKLLEAVPKTARIILLGDKDQLAAVESGAVFSELSANPALSDARLQALASLCGLPPGTLQAPAAGHDPGLRDVVVWLNRNFRFAGGSGIGQLAAEINSGDMSGVMARLRTHPDESLAWIEDGGKGVSEGAARRIYEGYSVYMEAVRRGGQDVAALFEAFGRFRTLCAVREGARGVEAINRMVSHHFRSVLSHPLDPGGWSEWYPGRPVMVLRNDYVLRLYNGDIGLALPDGQGGLVVWFPDMEAGFRSFAPVRLPEHETAFAMTVHKSQGSEFDEVLLMLPAEHNRVLTRQLVYTAITRARERVTLVGGEAVLAESILASTPRHSGLSARLSP